MRVQSIRAAIEPGDPAGNGFFRLAREVPFREVNRVAKAHDLAQKVGAMAKTLEDPRHLLAARMRAPFVIDLRHLAGCVSILNKADLCYGICHMLQWQEGNTNQIPWTGSLFAGDPWLFATPSQPCRPLACQKRPLQNQAVVPRFPRDAFAVKIFQ